MNDYFDSFNEMFLVGNMNSSNNQNKSQSENNQTTNENGPISGPYEGFIRGNMFPRSFDTYKNFQPTMLVPTNEKEEALLNLSQMHFAMHEMNLLLDVYPNDANAMRQFVNFRNNYLQQLNNYQSKYGALEVTSEYSNDVPFAWADQKWPWDRGNM